MRLRNKFLVYILVLCSSVSFTTAQKVLLVKADPICANQYEYLVNGLSSSDKHISYHIQQNASDKVILNTAQADLQQVKTGKESKVISSCDVNFTPELIREINSDKKRVYIVYEKEGTYVAQKVSSGIYVEEDDKFVRYSGPYYSFTYNKSNVYDPAERLAYGNSANKQAQFLANSEATIGCHKTINLIKVINETHPKHSFSMIANDDFKKLTTDQIVETCQKPLNIELAEGIGIVQEKTINCDIQLVAINGQPLNQFLTDKCNGTTPALANRNQLDLVNNTFKGGQAILTKPSTSRSKYFLTEPVSNKPNFDFTENTTKGYSVKGGETKKAGVYFYAKPVDVVEGTEMKTKEGNIINIEYNYENINDNKESIDELEEPIITIKGTTESMSIHDVNTGETLYSISQKYNTTVETLKALNKLENNTIYPTQQLKVK